MNLRHPNQPNICAACALASCAQCPHLPASHPDIDNLEPIPDVDGLSQEQNEIADLVESAIWQERIEYAASFRTKSWSAVRSVRGLLNTVPQQLSEN